MLSWETLGQVAGTGRTVITTIHQPSVDVFAKFDDILLLQRGGYEAYFGPLGYHGEGAAVADGCVGDVACPLH